MLKVGDQVAVGKLTGKIIRISDRSVRPLYKIKYDNFPSSSPWRYGWGYEKNILRIVVMCA